MKTTATTEAVSSPPEEKGYWSTKWRQNTTYAGQKPRADWKNVLQIRGAGRKPPTPVVGMKPYGKCQIIYVRPLRLMFKQIKDFFASNRETDMELEARAVAAAIRHFESTSGPSLHSGKVIFSNKSYLVVRIWTTVSFPPGRAWIKMSRALTDFQGLS